MDENAIEKLLINDWSSGLRITSVPQAMHRLGFADDLETRWRITNTVYDRWQSILASPEKIQSAGSAIGLKNSTEVEGLSQLWIDQVVTWGRASILLTDNEKLIARHIWSRHLQGLPLPGYEDTATALEISAEELYDGIQMLTRLGYLALQSLSPPGSPPSGGYTLAEGAERFHEGLGFTFHTVTLDDDEQFGIP